MAVQLAELSPVYRLVGPPPWERNCILLLKVWERSCCSARVEVATRSPPRQTVVILLLTRFSLEVCSPRPKDRWKEVTVVLISAATCYLPPWDSLGGLTETLEQWVGQRSCGGCGGCGVG